MDQPKHTPGPWLRHAVTQLQSGTMVEVTSASGYVVATAWGGGPIDNETDANARLIAAAPDLLEIVKCLAEWGLDGWESPRRTRPADEWDFELIRPALAAIAKAEGQE